MSVNFKENKKVFGREVNTVQKTKEQLGTTVLGAKGEITKGSTEVRRRWIKYFEGLLYIFDDGPADVGCFG